MLSIGEKAPSRRFSVVRRLQLKEDCRDETVLEFVSSLLHVVTGIKAICASIESGENLQLARDEVAVVIRAVTVAPYLRTYSA